MKLFRYLPALILLLPASVVAQTTWPGQWQYDAYALADGRMTHDLTFRETGTDHVVFSFGCSQPSHALFGYYNFGHDFPGKEVHAVSLRSATGEVTATALGEDFNGLFATQGKFDIGPELEAVFESAFIINIDGIKVARLDTDRALFEKLFETCKAA